MNFWHCSMVYEGDHAVTTHLTECGALRAAVFDIMDFLGLEDMEDRDSRSGDPLVTDHTLIANMKQDDLLAVFRLYAEETWDNHQGYSIEIIRSSLQA